MKKNKMVFTGSPEKILIEAGQWVEKNPNAAIVSINFTYGELASELNFIVFEPDPEKFEAKTVIANEK